MPAVRKKLKSASGASMLLALLFLFFCLTVGSIVLTAASANAGRTARIRREQQDYLAVESAARQLRESLSGLTFTGVYTQQESSETVIEGPDEDGTMSSYTNYLPTRYAFNTASLSSPGWSQLLCRSNGGDLYELFQCEIPPTTLPASPTSHRLVLSLAGNEGLSGISISLTVQSDYAFTVELWDKDGSNPMIFTLRPSKSERTAPNSGQIPSTLSPRGDSNSYTDHILTITWTADDITKGAYHAPDSE